MPCSPRMTGCTIKCLHYQLVDDYRQERERQFSAAEESALGYETELNELRPDLITFRQWLVANRGRNQCPST